MRLVRLPDRQHHHVLLAAASECASPPPPPRPLREAGLNVEQDALGDHAKGSIRDTFVTVYARGTYPSSGLKIRQALCVGSKDAFTSSCLWKEAEGFSHQDVSQDNLASGLPAVRLAAKEAVILAHLRRQLSLLQDAATNADKAWWQDWAQGRPGPGPLCVIMDLENATFSHQDQTDQEEERHATWSGTVAYWSQLNWQT